MVRLPEILLADANVLIDYAKADLDILGIAAATFRRVVAPREVILQARQVSVATCENLGIEILDPETEVLLAAASHSKSLGFHDALCLLLCEQNRWTCLTSDGALVRACERRGVAVRRGLNLMLELVGTNRLSKPRARTTALTMRSQNRFLTDAVIADFLARLEELS